MDQISPEDLRRLGAGDVDALDVVFRVFGDRIYRTCLGVLGQPADAEDAAQEVLLRIRDKASQCRGAGAFWSWAYQLTIRHCLNLLSSRRRGREELGAGAEEEPGSEREGPHERACRQEGHERLLAWLQGLDPPGRSVLVLYELEGLRYREIAEVLELPIGTVMSRLARARRKITELAVAGTGAAALPTKERS